MPNSLDPYQLPIEPNSVQSPSMTRDNSSETLDIPTRLAIGFAFTTFKVALLLLAAALYWLGGAMAVQAVFIGLPIVIVVGLVGVVAWAKYREPQWILARHAYLKRKRRRRWHRTHP